MMTAFVPGVEVGKFALVAEKGGRFVLTLPVTLAAGEQEAARALVEELFGVRGAKVEPLRGRAGP